LANKGLLRRAQKDLDLSPPAIVAVEEGLVQVRLADVTVDAVELLSKCACSCPATGICRHILSALIFLRDSPELAACDGPAHITLFDEESPAATTASRPEPIEAPAPSPAEVLANLSDEELQKWAGKSLVRKALKILAADLPVEIEVTESLIVRFPTRNITRHRLASGRSPGKRWLSPSPAAPRVRGRKCWPASDRSLARWCHWAWRGFPRPRRGG
jgi:hypothetical protein